LEGDLRPRLGDKLLVKKFKDAPHGFAVRGDDMIASEKAQKEEAYVLMTTELMCRNNDGMTFVKKWFSA